jgi:hypothetical protein
MSKTKEKQIWELIDSPGVKVDRFSPDNDDAVRMMQNLASQDVIRTRIPREAKEPVDAIATVILDSVRINILKGVSVSLPVQIADTIEDAYYKTEKALAPQIRNPFSGQMVEARMDKKSDTEVAQL